MGRTVNGFQRVGAHLRTDLGGGQLRVAEHRLDKADIPPAFEHVRGHRVAQQVAGAGFVDNGFDQVFFSGRPAGVFGTACPDR